MSELGHPGDVRIIASIYLGDVRIKACIWVMLELRHMYLGHVRIYGLCTAC